MRASGSLVGTESGFGCQSASPVPVISCLTSRTRWCTLQQHGMGLTIHYGLAIPGDEARARQLVLQLHQAALDLPIQHVGEVAELVGDARDSSQRAKDDPYRWLRIQTRAYLALPATSAERPRGVRRETGVLPQHVIAFETLPGDACEQANFGRCRMRGSANRGLSEFRALGGGRRAADAGAVEDGPQGAGELESPPW
jgi:hypothetical protein